MNGRLSRSLPVALPGHTLDTGGHHRSGRRVQPIAGPLTTVNSVLSGGTPGQARRTVRGARSVGAVGMITGAGALTEYLARQRATGQAARQPASVPSPANSNRPSRVGAGPPP